MLGYSLIIAVGISNNILKLVAHRLDINLAFGDLVVTDLVAGELFGSKVGVIGEFVFSLVIF